MPKDETARKKLKIPKRTKYSPIAEGVTNVLNHASNFNDAGDKMVTALTTKGTRALKFNSPLTKQHPDVNRLDQALGWSGVVISGILYLFNLIGFKRNKNRVHIETTNNFALDTAKVVINTVGAILVVAAAPAVVAVATTVLSVVAASDFFRSFIALAYNFGRLLTTSRSNYERRKYYWERTKATGLRTIVAGVITLLTVVGNVVAGAAAPIAYTLGGITAALLIKGIVDQCISLKKKYFPSKTTKEIKEFKKQIKDQKNKKNTEPEPQLVRTKSKPSIVAKNIVLRGNLNKHLHTPPINGLTFSLDKIYKHLKDSLEGFQKSDLFEFRDPARDALNPKLQYIKANAKQLNKDMPNPLQKLKKYDEFVVTKKGDLNWLEAELFRDEERLRQEYFVSKELGDYDELEKRYQKIYAEQDLRFIVRQLKLIMKERDKTVPHMLFLSVDKAKQAFDTQVIGGSVLKLTFDDLYANIEKIWDEFKLYFDKTYPLYQNSSFKDAGTTGPGSGKVKSLFDSVEACIKQKSVDELNDQLIGLKKNYAVKKDQQGNVVKAQTKEQEEKHQAIVYFLSFLNKLTPLLDPEHPPAANEKIILSTEKTGISMIYQNGVVTYKSTKLHRATNSEFWQASRKFDLKVQAQKDELMTLWWDDAELKFPGLANSIDGCGKVADAGNEIKNLMCTHDFSHLVQQKQVPMVPAAPTLPPLQAQPPAGGAAGTLVTAAPVKAVTTPVVPSITVSAPSSVVHILPAPRVLNPAPQPALHLSAPVTTGSASSTVVSASASVSYPADRKNPILLQEQNKNNARKKIRRVSDGNKEGIKNDSKQNMTRRRSSLDEKISKPKLKYAVSEVSFDGSRTPPLSRALFPVSSSSKGTSLAASTFDLPLSRSPLGESRRNFLPDSRSESRSESSSPSKPQFTESDSNLSSPRSLFTESRGRLSHFSSSRTELGGSNSSRLGDSNSSSWTTDSELEGNNSGSENSSLNPTPNMLSPVSSHANLEILGSNTNTNYDVVSDSAPTLGDIIEAEENVSSASEDKKKSPLAAFNFYAEQQGAQQATRVNTAPDVNNLYVY